MTIMTIRIPDAVAAAFDKAFEGEDKDAVIAGALQRIADERTQSNNAEQERVRRRMEAVDAILQLREKFPALSNEDIRKARQDGRP